MEIPSGTVNGSNVTFTVTHAPLFIDVLGQLNVSSTQDATNYGYTLSGLTVTFVNAPTQTPHSFYNSGSGTNFVYNEVVSGSGTTFTLAHTPIAGTQTVYGLGQLLTPTVDYTISGINIVTTNSWLSGQIVANYQY